MHKFIVLTVAVLVAVPLVAHAEIDCSGVPKYNHDHTYKKGDRAWTVDGSGNYRVYSCEKDQCTDFPDNSGWKFLGGRAGSYSSGSCK